VLETAGAVCHELNQPMMAALGYTDLSMIDLAEGNPLYSKISNIREQIERMGDITRKLMGITQYHIKDYGTSGQIIDIDKSSSFRDSIQQSVNESFPRDPVTNSK